MNPFAMKTIFAVALLVLAGLMTATNARAEKTPAASGTVATNAPAIPQSVFDENGGKDPFFPNRFRASETLKPDTTDIDVSDFVLNGITPFGLRPTAIINGRTFEKGEQAEVKIAGGGKILIKCLDIRESSAIITIENLEKPVELRRRSTF